MGKKRRETLSERMSERKEQRKTMKERRMADLEERYRYQVKLDMAKQDG